jgi:hypothetical protein
MAWSTQVGPVLNEDSPGALREAIKRAHAELLEKIGELTRDASPAATGSRRRRPPRNLATIRLRSLNLRLASWKHNFCPVEHVHEQAPGNQQGRVALVDSDHDEY